MGIGPGNWYQTIGSYLPELEGKDSHNTYVKCTVELGILGISLFVLLLLQAYLNLRKVYQGVETLSPAAAEDFSHLFFAMVVSLVVIFTCALTITMIYTEVVWLLLMLPVCLKRAFENAMIENGQLSRISSL